MGDDGVVMVPWGSHDWRRWRIYHEGRDRWWGNGAWKKRWQDAEVWTCPFTAEGKLKEVAKYANQYGLEDE